VSFYSGILIGKQSLRRAKITNIFMMTK